MVAIILWALLSSATDFQRVCVLLLRKACNALAYIVVQFFMSTGGNSVPLMLDCKPLFNHLLQRGRSSSVVLKTLYLELIGCQCLQVIPVLYHRP